MLGMKVVRIKELPKRMTTGFVANFVKVVRIIPAFPYIYIPTIDQDRLYFLHISGVAGENGSRP